MKPAEISNYNEDELFKAFISAKEPNKQHKRLSKLYKWGNRKLFNAVAQRIKAYAKNSPDTVQVWDGRRVTISNIHRYCEKLCEYINGDATLIAVMRQYCYEADCEATNTMLNQLLPAKLATYFRLCDEARKRCAKMYYDSRGKREMYDRQERWAEAYYHKKRQVDEEGRKVCGHKAYYDVVVLMAIYDDTKYNKRVIDVTLDAAKQAIIELNKE